MTVQFDNPQIIAYARKGWAVFSVHTWSNGCCTCGKTDCDRPAKHPWCEQGFYSATTDEARITAWAKAKPGCNWGIRTGTASGLLVLDVDADKHGEESLAELEAAHGALPSTPTVRTGGGGRQFYLRYPQGSGLTIDQRIRPGIDYRGESGYIVAPPSLHRSGNRYEWIVPPETPLADAPAWLVKVLTEKKATAQRPASANPGMVLTVQDDPPDLLTSPGVGEGERNGTLCRLVGVHLARGDSQPTIETLAKAWGERCNPPMTEAEVERTVSSLAQRHRNANPNEATLFVRSQPSPAPAPDSLPDVPVVAPGRTLTLHADALHGLAGEIIRAIQPETEADPAGILLSLLVAFGNVVGPGPYFVVGKGHHRANLFAVLVGKTAAGKGEAWDYAHYLLVKADPTWATKCIAFGLGSGEGLVDRVRNEVSEIVAAPNPEGKGMSMKMAVIDPGAEDKRLLCIETEFVKPVVLMRREQSTLSAHLRNAWDGKPLEVMNRRNNHLTATDAHVSIIAHMTPAEWGKMLGKSIETVNGFLNRFLICHVERRNLLPDGGDASVIDRFAEPLAKALAKAKGIHEMTRSEEAKRLWYEVYERLADASDSATERARPQVLRLSMLYALLDGVALVGVEHLKAALALWDYCEASAHHLFGKEGNNTDKQEEVKEPLSVRLLDIITKQPGINRRKIYEALGGRANKENLDPAFAYLKGAGLAHAKACETGGRPGECWYPGADEAEQTTEANAEHDEADLCSIARNESAESEMQASSLSMLDPVSSSRNEAEPMKPIRQAVKIEEIPMPANGSLVPMGLPELFDSVRQHQGRFVTIDGVVHAACRELPDSRINAAVMEHQDQLCLLVGNVLPTDDELLRLELQKRFCFDDETSDDLTCPPSSLA